MPDKRKIEELSRMIREDVLSLPIKSIEVANHPSADFKPAYIEGQEIGDYLLQFDEISEALGLGTYHYFEVHKNGWMFRVQVNLADSPYLNGGENA